MIALPLYFGFRPICSAMMRAALEGVVVIEEAGVTLAFNPSARRIFGHAREEVRRKRVADRILPEAQRKGLEHHIASGEDRGKTAPESQGDSSPL